MRCYIFVILSLLLSFSYEESIKIQPNPKIQTNRQKNLLTSWTSQNGNKGIVGNEQYRTLNLLQNQRSILSHNLNPKSTYVQGLTKFAIYTQKQFASQFLKSSDVETIVITGVAALRNIRPSKTPPIVDWVINASVSKIKEQGMCGSCWSFSAVSIVESMYMAKRISYDLSEQQLVDCDPISKGCLGGYSNKGLQYILNNGITLESIYPYQSSHGYAYQCMNPTGSIKISEVKQVLGCEAMVAQIYHSPITVSVDASNWYLYVSGIYSDPPGITKYSINHDAVIVGYYPNQYWLIKNSWGVDFGMKGFIRLSTNANTSGMCLSKSYWAA